MMSELHASQGDALDVNILSKPAVNEFISAHANVLNVSFDGVPMSDTMRSHLQQSDWIFSGLKTFHELNEAFPSLIGSDGNRKPFETFLKDVQKIDKTYNRNYLRAEYNYAHSAAKAAAEWERIADPDTADIYDLQYRTVGDGLVRPEHAALDMTTLPVDDPFWQTYYPPNGWNCRCYVVRVRKGKYPTSSSKEAQQRGAQATAKDKNGMFHYNPGIQRKTFPDYNPYTISRCRTCLVPKATAPAASASGISLASPPNNQLCQACQLLRNEKVKDTDTGIRADLEQLHDLTGAEFSKKLAEIIGRREFKPVDSLKEVFSTGGERAEDYNNLINGAKKAVAHGYSVYILPNPKGLRTGDYILKRKNICKLFDLKTISGESSAGNRMKESIGQANRVLLNMTTTYNPRILAKDIKDYFEDNPDAREVVIFKGKREISVTRGMINNEFIQAFMRIYHK